jgi:YD repeat-containing protein
MEDLRATSLLVTANLRDEKPMVHIKHSAVRLRRHKRRADGAVRPNASTLVCFLLLALLPTPSPGQQPITFQYIYDDLNQLTKVIDSTGIVIQYVYDPVGNILQINRATVQPGVLTLFNISPQSVPTGGILTIQGQGFSTTTSANIVLINGIAATVVSATANNLQVLVPANATTGTVSVTVGGTTVTSTTPVTVIPLPVITSLSPKSALAGTTIAALTVTGINLTGATFAFSLPTVGLISGPTVAAGGTSATMTVILSASAQGRLTLLATNAAGPSDGIPKLGFLPGSPAFNTLTVPGSNPNADPDNDGLSNAQEIQLGTDPLNADTDGDTYVDGLEVLLRSDPLNPNSIPKLYTSGWFASPIMSMLNNANPAAPIAGAKQFVSGLTFSMLNTLNPSTGLPGSKQFVSGLTFSLLNTLNPSSGVAGSKQFVSGPTFSMLNTLNPSTGLPGSKQFVSGLTFSMLNTLNPSSGVAGSKQFVSGPTFSTLNTLNPSTGLPGSKQFVSGLTLSLLNRISPAPTTPSQRFTNSLIFSISNAASATPAERVFRLFTVDRIAERIARPWLFADLAHGAIDSDGDGISDEDEIRLGTNPFDRDTDHDGYPDGLEIALGSDPLDPNSIPNINPPGFTISPAVSVQNYSLSGMNIVPGRPANFRRNNESSLRLELDSLFPNRRPGLRDSPRADL